MLGVGDRGGIGHGGGVPVTRGGIASKITGLSSGHHTQHTQGLRTNTQS